MGLPLDFTILGFWGFRIQSLGCRISVEDLEFGISGLGFRD